jgi:hypothetical protein
LDQVNPTVRTGKQLGLEECGGGSKKDDLDPEIMSYRS